jgi:hypothetical protein
MTPKDQVFRVLAGLGDRALDPIVSALTPDERTALAKILEVDYKTHSKSIHATEETALQKELHGLTPQLYSRLKDLTLNTSEDRILRPAALLALKNSW